MRRLQNQNLKFRVLYFNNPDHYYKKNFENSITFDLISFFEEDLGTDYFKEITEEFLNIRNLMN